jgi:hypothetical protein
MQGTILALTLLLIAAPALANAPPSDAAATPLNSENSAGCKVVHVTAQ